MKAIGKIIGKIVLVFLGLFAVAFSIYFFNLDMKATALLEPILMRHYDRIERKTYL
jgi:hypothetical protein